MRAFRVAPMLLLAVCLVPALAGAKEIEKAVVCGAEECRTVPGGMDELGFIVTSGGTESAPGPDGAAFFTIETFVKAEDGSDDSWTIAYMPDTGYARSFPVDDEEVVWWKLTAAEQRPFDALVGGLEPATGAAAVTTSSSSFPLWETLAGVLAACAVAAAALLLARRMRHRRRPAPAV